jgi:hypothetical protein
MIFSSLRRHSLENETSQARKEMPGDVITGCKLESDRHPDLVTFRER